jgi:hypothetical protein
MPVPTYFLAIGTIRSMPSTFGGGGGVVLVTVGGGGGGVFVVVGGVLFVEVLVLVLGATTLGVLVGGGLALVVVGVLVVFCGVTVGRMVGV